MLDGILYLMGGDYNKCIFFYEPKEYSFKYINNLYLNSSTHTNSQVFVVDTKSINRNNILKYYSSNKI